MENIPYFLVLAAVFALVSFGVQRRKPWVWYLGLVFFYLVAGFAGAFFFSALFYAVEPGVVRFGLVCLGGGLVFWMPLLLFWINQRDHFIRAPKPRPHGEPVTKTEDKAPGE